MLRKQMGIVRLILSAAVAAITLPSLATPVAAHEVPASVAVQAYVKPEGDRLRMLVRVPLASLRDFDWPLHGPGLLDHERLDPMLRDAAILWITDYVELYENGARLSGEQVMAVRVTQPSDRSFVSYEAALRHVRGTLDPAAQLVWDQALFDVLIEVPIASEDSRFSLDPALAHLGVQTTSVLHFLPPAGGERVFQYTGNPGVVELDPRWHQAALGFVKLGFLHILEGIDHLLFILCLVIPFRRFRGLVPVVTAFTVAHSVTLIASAFGFAPSGLWFPPLIETLIALSIVYMAFENIVGVNLQRRWIVAFAFGLVHGFGFSFLLRESLQFAGGHLLTSLVAFNVGVELGQLLVLLLTIPALEWLFRSVRAERVGTILLSALIAHSAWHWMTDRGGELLQHELAMPALDLAFAAGVMRWLMLLLISGGVVWMLATLFGRFWPPAAEGGPAAGAGG